MEPSQVLDLPLRNTHDPVTPINTHPLPNQQTPLTYKAATQFEHSMNLPLSNETYERIGKETSGHYFVGMEPQDFLEEFLPWNKATRNEYKQRTPTRTKINALKSVPPTTGQKEAHMYAPFIQALDGWVTGTDNKQKLRFGHFSKPDATCGSMNVDISTYWASEFPQNAAESRQGPVPDSCSFAHQQTHEEFKSSVIFDAFTHESDEGPNTAAIEEDDDDSTDAGDSDADSDAGDSDADSDQNESDAQSLHASVEVDNQRGNHTRGQIAAYAGIAMSMSFRKHFFSMLILGEYARIIRWDRRGAIVTRRFNYTERPELIFDFYLRFGQLTRSQRGLDDNVVPFNDALPSHVAKAFDKYYQQSWYQGAKYGHKDNSPPIPASTLPFFRIKIEDKTYGRSETFFMPAPVYRYSHLQPFNRASRRSLVYFDGPNQKMCFLKDSWQEASKRTSPEADIYRKLHANNVPNIAALRLGGDVAGFKTETQNKFHVLSHSGRYKTFGALVCHRLVLDTVARDLSTFTWCKVLLSCLADAVDAAQQAYKAGVLHRDISAGNIMIVRNEETNEWRGVLIDWDMCLLLAQRNNRNAIRTARTGTWAFMSSRLLASAMMEGPVIHSLTDDMESIFWVLAYQCLRYTAHNLKPVALYNKMHNIFDDSADWDGERVGGSNKQNTLHACTGGVKRAKMALADFSVDGLLTVIRNLAKEFDAGYDDDEDDDPSVKLNSPDDKWLSSSLRDAAFAMTPLNVTPFALISPTNDSRPDVDQEKWAPANISTAKVDYFAMRFSRNENDSSRAQSDYWDSLTKSMPFKVDGLSYQSNKRHHDDDGDFSEGPTQAKKSRAIA